MKRIGVRRLAFAALLLCVSVSQAERYTVPLLVPAGTSADPQGVLRILNATDGSGSVEIYAIDDAGARSGPASFTLNAWAAVEFTATDLQSGNAQSGLNGGIGAALGNTRLEIETDLHIVPLAYVRAADGTLSTMHDTVRAAGVDGSGRYTYEVPSFNPASDAVHASRLRLINPGDTAASVTIGARDDTGAAASGGAVELTLAKGAAQTLTAQQLEAGDVSITGQLGAGTGKWRLTVSSDRPIQVLNAVSSTFGHMNNLSTTAVAGSAPVDHGAFMARFLDTEIGFQADSGDFTFVPAADDTFAETAERDGVTTSSTGRYVYAAQGPDAGRVAASYDDGIECAANLYFASRTAGWFARNCTAANDPDGHWLAGTWSVTDGEGDGGGDGGTDNTGSTPPVKDDTPVPGSLGACQVGMSLSSGQSCTYPGTADAFSVNVRGRGSFLDRLAGIRIRIDNETINGRDYDFEASHQGNGVWRIDRIAGSTEPTTGGSGGTVTDTSPRFAAGTNPGNQTYTMGTAIDTLTLPEASAGDGTLMYSLTPDVPGLSFDAMTRQLTGIPTTATSYSMNYTVTDEDGDTDTINFAIKVEESDDDGGSVSGSVSIPDANLRAAIEAALDKTSTDPITDADMESLTSLPASSMGIGDLTGLGSATNLTRLNLWENQIEDLSVLSSLTNLTWLQLGANNITDISALSVLTNLEYLSLDYNNVSVISHLSGLISLTTLGVRRNDLTSISALSTLTNLEELSLSDNSIVDISPLAGLTKLERLNLGNSGISNISALAGMANLTVLILNRNDITELSPLSSLTDLTYLDLSVNNVTDVSALSGLTNLRTVDLRGNFLSDSSIAEAVPAIQSRGVEVFFHTLSKGDFDIDLVFLDDFTDSQQRELRYAMRRWMSVIVEDLPDYVFAEGWSGMCGEHSFEIPSGERIDDVRIYVSSFEDLPLAGYGSPRLLREQTHLPVVGCMGVKSSGIFLSVTGAHELGHVLGFTDQVWDKFGFFQIPPDGDAHFSGPQAIAAFDGAGGHDYPGAKVPLEFPRQSHWRTSVLPGELMGAGGGQLLSAITVQSMADIGYGVDITEADPYTQLRVVGLANDGPMGPSTPPSEPESMLSYGLEPVSQPIVVVNQRGRVIRVMGN